MSNIDPRTVDGFGEEWSRFDQSDAPDQDLEKLFDDYFRLFPWELISPTAVGADIGCGSGRWARFVAPRVGQLLCIDPSPKALDVARRNLRDHDNCEFIEGVAGALPVENSSLDFGFSLGVLHHAPDPAAAMADCVQKLKPGAPFLMYLYYALDNRPLWFRAVWRTTDIIRQLVSRLPFRVRYWFSQLVALLVYLPLARLAKLLEAGGRDVDPMPLSTYRNLPFYFMRNDALDRLGTRVEHRFTADEIRDMMAAAGLERVSIAPTPPYWCAVGYRTST